MKNPYTARLEAELAAIIRKRIGQRKVIERSAFGAGDDLDRRRNAEAAARELAWCQREYERLHHELGRPLPHAGPVKLDAPVSARTAMRPTVAPVRRGAVRLDTRQIGYLTKDMRAGR